MEKSYHIVSRNTGVAIWILATLTLWPLYALIPPNPDQELYDFIGLVGSWGGKYYIDASDINWPGVMLLHEAAARLFGAHIWSFRTFDFILLLVGAASLAALLRSSGQVLASWLVLPLYELMYVTTPGDFSAERDIIAGHVLCLAAATFAYAFRSTRRTLFIITGALTAYAVLIRPTYLTYLAYLCCLLFVPPRTSRKTRANQVIIPLAYLMSGAAAVALFAVVLGWLNGNLEPWYEQAVLFNFFLYSHSHNTIYADRSHVETIRLAVAYLLVSFHWYLVFSAFGLISWVFLNGLSTELLLSVGVVCTGLISAFVQNAGWPYHLGAILPILGLLTAIWLATLLEWFWKNPKNLFVALSAFSFWSIAAVGLGKKAVSLRLELEAIKSGDYSHPLKTGNEIRLFDIVQTADFVRNHTKPNDYVLVWSRHSHILYLSGRRSTTHFINVFMLTFLNSSFSLAAEWYQQFSRELAERPPALIIIHTPETSEVDMFYEPRDANEPVERVRALVNANSRRVAKFGNFLVFQPYVHD